MKRTRKRGFAIVKIVPLAHLYFVEENTVLLDSVVIAGLESRGRSLVVREASAVGHRTKLGLLMAGREGCDLDQTLRDHCSLHGHATGSPGERAIRA